jgi:cobalt/nickel transport system ATP-binding protein
MPSDEQPAIQVRSLSYAYSTGQPALKDVSFEVGPHETVALVGPSGAGKSTLLMHLNGLLPDRLPGKSDSAFVAIAGQPLRRENVQAIRQRVGFVFQDPDDQLFCPTVREDVAFGPLNLGLSRQEVLARVTDSLTRVGLAEYENRSTLQLSLGERKRVCLAGVLACHPDVLVLDEPFSNLDPRARRRLIEILRQFSGSQIIATHDLDLAVDLCDRVLVLDSGQIHAAGPVREILADAALMEEHGLEVPWQLR